MTCEAQTVASAPQRMLDPERLGDHVDQLYRAAWALCGSRHDAEDLVQETFLNVLKRPRLLRKDNELGYLLRALRNTFSSRYRVSARQVRCLLIRCEGRLRMPGRRTLRAAGRRSSRTAG